MSSPTIRTIEELSPDLGMLPTTMIRIFRKLKEDNLIPAGRPGHGAPRPTKRDFAYLTMSWAAQQPSEASAAVLAFRSLRWMRHPLPDGVKEPLPTFEDQLADYIEGYGAARRNNATWDAESEQTIRSSTLQLCLNPLQALMVVRRGQPDEHTVVYTNDPYAARPGLSRLTIISGDVLLKLAELLADTEDNSSAATNFLGNLPVKAGPKTESAGHPRQGTPAPISDQPRANETGGLPALPETTREDHGFQGKPRRGQVTPSRKKEPTNA